MSTKDSEIVKYPQSAELFRFCKEALAIKHNHEVRVIDQHVGAILGFDPADCSHWKRGKKNIKSLQTVNTIAKHLQVDARVVTDLIAGRANYEESIQEYKGYGPTELSSGFYEGLKRDYFRDPASFAVDGKSRSFDELTSIDGAHIDQAAKDLLEKAGVQSCPVMIPEILAVMPEVQLELTNPGNDGEAESSPVLSGGAGAWVLKVPARVVSKPHGRFIIARAIGRIILDPGCPLSESSELVDARCNHFAAALLMPYDLFAVAMRELDDTRDIVAQLAEAFWMSRSTVNIRLKSLMIHMK